MKINLILLFTSLTFAANVTFNVDMALQDVGNEGPTLWMGHLYPEPGFQMEDLDGDGIWSYTIDLDEGTYTYKFRNGWWTDWNTGSGWEEVPSGYTLNWNASQMPSGVYLVRAETAGSVSTQKLMLLK